MCVSFVYTYICVYIFISILKEQPVLFSSEYCISVLCGLRSVFVWVRDTKLKTDIHQVNVRSRSRLRSSAP